MACLSVSGHKFLGATVTGINSSLGWGSSGTSMTVSLVEDECAGDNFNPPVVGSPVCVNVGDGGWNFGGFLDEWQLKSSHQSGHIFDVKISDPTDLLSGYSCILGNYDGSTFGVPNLANVFGYLENFLGTSCQDWINGDSSGVNYTPAFGWGGSHINSGGIPSTLVVQALSSILNGGGGTFGTFPYYRNNSYNVDISRLAYLPVYSYNYRIGGDSMSVLDVVDRMCKDSGFDYYLGLDCLGTTVTVYPVRINRAFGGFVGAYNMDVSAGDVDAGDIASVIATGVHYSSKSVGLNHRKETLNAFTVGDNFQGIHQVTKVDTCKASNATIWPYWGDDWTGTPIIANGCGDDHEFIADSREWNVAGVGAYYKLTVGEIRAALVGQSEWKAWLKINKEALAELLQLDPELDFLALIEAGNKKPVKPQGMQDQAGKINVNAGERKGDAFDIEKNITNLYNAIKQMADEFYGKKYMAVVPFICKYFEDDTGELKTNWERSDSGWSEAGVIGLGSATPGLQVFKGEDGKIQCFIRYDNAEKMDLTSLQKGDFYFESGYVWIKASVQKLVQTGGKFWAVLDLKMRSFLAKGEDDEHAGAGFYLRLIKDAKDNGKIDDDQEQQAKDKLNDLNSKPLYLKDGPRAIIPDAAAIPLKSNKVSYGPWYAGYLGGKTDYQRETNFSPWSFGSAAVMQLAGSIHTIHKVTNVEVAEKGSVSTPGYPVAFLGDRAMAITGTAGGGPIITDIDVKHDVSGVSTTYQFKTFTPKWGSLSKSIIDGMQRRGQAIQRNNHRLLQRMLEPPPPNHPIYRMRYLSMLAMNNPEDPAKDKNQSTHDVFAAYSKIWTKEEYPDGDWTGENEERALQNLTTGQFVTDYSWTVPVTSDWTGVAAVEPAGIFRPFATEDSTKMSNYLATSSEGNDQMYNDDQTHGETSFDESDGTTKTSKFYSKSPMPPINDEYHMPITIKTLNPFKKRGGIGIYGFDNMNDSDSGRHDIDFVVRGDTWPTEVNLSSPNFPDTNYRSISLRGPLILTGWGFDLDGKPIPAKPGNKAAFADDWLTKPHDWKTGPLDVRWDNERGVWAPPPSFKLLNAKCCECVGPATSKGGWFQLVNEDDTYDKDGNNSEGVDSGCNCDTDSEQVFAMNRTGKVVLPDAKVLLYYDTRKHKYYVITAPDPIVIAKMNDLMMPDETTEKATIEKGIHGLGTFNSSCGNIVQVTNTLKQPICKDSKAFIYLTKCNSSASDGGSDDYNFEGEVLQAEFEPLTVVTSVDCYEHPDSGEPTLEICDRRIYVQTAYTIEDCGDDSPSARNDTKGWRPGVDFDDKKNQAPSEGDFCPEDWNRDETG